MATKAKKLTPARKSKKGDKSGTNNRAYARLRTILDSLEIGAIRYFALAPTAAQKEKRTDEMDEALKPIIQYLWGQSPEDIGVLGVDCPEGYTDCHGVCVPYPCPDW
jgi:hypothetical protein